MTFKVSIVSLGCPKNQVDAQNIAGNLKDKGFEFTENPNEADVMIINTCAFIESAKEESISAILDAADYKKENLKCLVVTGCLSQRYKAEIKRTLPEVDLVAGIHEYDKLAKSIFELLGEYKRGIETSTCLKKTPRLFNLKRSYEYIKIADGCDNRCTYCAIPNIRGKYKSRKMEDILSEAQRIESLGFKELILVAQDTSFYGRDIYGEYKLYELLRRLSRLSFKWIRFLYGYPERIDDKLIEVMAANDNIVNYLDIPLQHINNTILKRMNRTVDKTSIYNLINRCRRDLKDVTVRTSLIVGFPGETDEQFRELLEFVKDIKLDRLGCFEYSKEEGTPAAEFSGQVSNEVKRRRRELIMFEQQKVLEEKGRQMVGKEVEAVAEGFEDGEYVGRTEKDAPEIDCNIYFKSKCSLELGEYTKVLVKKSEFGDLYGQNTIKEDLV